MASNLREVILLTSGGLDSTACLHYYLERNFKVNPLFVDFGQPSASRELSAAKSVANHYGLSLHEITVAGYGEFTNGEIHGRNMFLVLVAYMFTKGFEGVIAMGIHSGTDYIDCSPEFSRQANNVLSMYSNGAVLFEAPFLQFQKLEIAQFCLENEVPINLTYSCELGLAQPCGKCLSCRDLIQIYDLKKFNT